MAYQIIKSGCFFSKFLLDDTLYELSAVPHCIRIRPYYGGEQFAYLRWCGKTYANFVQLPQELLRISKLKGKVYAFEVANTFYLVHPNFKGDPTAFAFPTFPTFQKREYPTEAFFKEAEMMSFEEMMHCDYKSHVLKTPLFRQKLRLRSNDYAQVTVFNQYGRRWMEVRRCDENGEKILRGQRLPETDFPEALSGANMAITYDSGLLLRSPFFADWNNYDLYAWYSETREAVIIEARPEECAACGGLIRSISPEHFRANACNHCVPHLGHDNAIDVIMHAKKVLQNVSV